MEQGTYIAALEEFCRAHEQALADVERQCAGAAARQAECEAARAELLGQVAELQLDQQADFGNRVKAELADRAREEQRERTRLVQAELREVPALAARDRARSECEALRHRLHADLAADTAFVVSAQAHVLAREARDALQPDYQELSAECSAKLAAYQAGDSLYGYLRQRRYGDLSYSALPPVRLLDAWIARLCHFKDNRAAEQTLLEMQQELVRRAYRLDMDLAEAESAERKLLAAAGAALDLPAAEARLAERNRELDVLQSAAAGVRAALAAYANKTDARYVTVQQMVRKFLQARSIDELADLAASTPAVEDDALVQRLTGLGKQSSALQQEYEALAARGRESREKRLRACEIRDSLLEALPDTGSVTRHFFEDELDLRAVLDGYVDGKSSAQQVHAEIGRYTRKLGPYHDDDGTISWIEVGKTSAVAAGTVLLTVGAVVVAVVGAIASSGGGSSSSSSSGSRRRSSSSSSSSSSSWGSSSSSSSASSSSGSSSSYDSSDSSGGSSYSSSDSSGGGSYSTSDSF
ncbi:hypothetical protein ASC94_30120 [Massilia sp. Root418]|uniref:hypothetical protein n=1 Tax=Massilia sp. Root418 TaxID=1736532 RepID=UPI0006FFB68D|nr:hypothetical protein [Massilia sp. Root418]KQX00436.1 hypothetical protein ASC94_30120 [Massilia sp. Root418]